MATHQPAPVDEFFEIVEANLRYEPSLKDRWSLWEDRREGRYYLKYGDGFYNFTHIELPASIASVIVPIWKRNERTSYSRGFIGTRTLISIARLVDREKFAAIEERLQKKFSERDAEMNRVRRENILREAKDLRDKVARLLRSAKEVGLTAETLDDLLD